MNKSWKAQDISGNQSDYPKKEKGILKAIGSIFVAIVASSHHWVHTLLITLGLTIRNRLIIAIPLG